MRRANSVSGIRVCKRANQVRDFCQRTRFLMRFVCRSRMVRRTAEDPPMTDESIFIAAVALPEADRAAYLDRACIGQPALRHDVEALPAAHAASNPPDRPALDPTGPNAVRPEPPAP